MAGDGDGLHDLAAEVELVALVVERPFRRFLLGDEPAEVGLRKGEGDFGIVAVRINHSGVVTVVVGEGDDELPALRALRNDAAEGLGGIVGPLDVV